MNDNITITLTKEQAFELYHALNIAISSYVGHTGRFLLRSDWKENTETIENLEKTQSNLHAIRNLLPSSSSKI